MNFNDVSTNKKCMIRGFVGLMLCCLLTCSLGTAIGTKSVSAATLYSKTTTSNKTTKKTTTTTKSCKKAKTTHTTTKRKIHKKTCTTTSTQKKVVTVTTTTTDKKSSYKKASKKKTVKKTVTTNVKTTTTSYVRPGNANINTISSFVGSKVTQAWKNSHYSLVTNSKYPFKSNSTYGFFNGNSIVLRYNIDHVFIHELGHFVSQKSGNTAQQGAFVSIYNAEKNKLTVCDTGYAKTSSGEYFAEAFKAYCLYPSTLKKTCPRTYNAVQTAVNKL